MQFAIAKWGNSLALRLPRHVIEEAKLHEGSPVALSVRDGEVVMTPVRKKFKLDALLAEMDETHKTSEVEWGVAEGEEDW